MNIDIKPFNATEAEASLDLKPHKHIRLRWSSFKIHMKANQMNILPPGTLQALLSD